MFAEGNEYDHKATIPELYTIAADVRRNDEVVRGAVTKAELKNVYSNACPPPHRLCMTSSAASKATTASTTVLTAARSNS